MNKGKDGRYHTSFRFEGRVYGVSGRTEQEVYTKIGAKKAALRAGKSVKPKRVTVRQYAKEWVAAYNKGDYQSILDNQILPELGDMALKEVTERDLQGFLNRKAGEYSKSYVTKMKLALSQMFRKARKNKLIVDDPAEDLVMPECKEGKRRSLTEWERGLLLSATENHRGKLFILCMLYCGLRPQEAAVLRWDHVDLEEGVIHILQARKRKTGEIGPPKSRAGVRDVPIPGDLEKALRSAQRAGDYVCAWDGKPISQKKESIMWANIKREMDILGGAQLYRNQVVQSVLPDDLDLYCIRHTYCTDLQKAGVPINIARELMGHSSIEVTAQIYTHTGTAEAKGAAQKLDGLKKSNVIYARFG
jgi:integrase